MIKKYLLFLAIACMVVAVPVIETGCTAAQTQSTYQTLDAVGHTAKNSMDAATSALKSGAITVATWQKIADKFDNVFQPAFNLAVAAAGTTSAQAPAALVAQQKDFSTSVTQLTSTP